MPPTSSGHHELRRARSRAEVIPAVTIGAPRDAVWPWLAQIGQGRGGLYSYDDLENLLGLEIRSADRSTSTRDPAPGELIRMEAGLAVLPRVVGEPWRSGADQRGQRPRKPPSEWPAITQPVTSGKGALEAPANSTPGREELLSRAVETIGFAMERRSCSAKDRASGREDGDVGPDGGPTRGSVRDERAASFGRPRR